MGYAAWSVVFGEQPSAAKWNILGTNDSSFNDGTGIAVSAITPEKLFTGTGTTWPWTTFTPTITLAGGATNGNAVITGAYQQTGKNVHFWVKYVVGSTTSFVGLTSITSTLPITMSAGFNTAAASGNYLNGAANIGGSVFPLMGFHVTTTTFRILALNAAGTYASGFDMTATIPGSWGVGSAWYVTGIYEAA